jgi:hypothetical protein
VIVASSDAQLRPSVMRAVGCRVQREQGTLAVYLARSQAARLLDDISRSGRIAVMFSRPSTHVTLQVKATRATIRAATEADREAIERYRLAFEAEVESVGHPRMLAGALLASRPDDLVAVVFEPGEVFEQTPGPKAGERVAGGAG